MSPVAVAFPTATATDTSGTVILQSVTPQPGSLFPVGDTTVTFTFADGSGNSASCSYTVTVTQGRFSFQFKFVINPLYAFYLFMWVPVFDKQQSSHLYLCLLIMRAITCDIWVHTKQ